jgi:hypothetical protein
MIVNLADGMWIVSGLYFLYGVPNVPSRSAFQNSGLNVLW